MPRVHHVKKARKDNPAVKKGESYYWWKHAYSPKRYSTTRPRASQLTQSDKLGRYYEAQETIEDLDADELIQDIVEVLREVAGSVREIGEEYQESADNIREHFEESEVADDCEEKASACETTADSIDEVASALETQDFDSITDQSDILESISWEL